MDFDTTLILQNGLKCSNVNWKILDGNRWTKKQKMNEHTMNGKAE